MAEKSTDAKRGKDAAPDPKKDAAKDAGTDPKKDAAKDAGTDPKKDSAKDAAPDPKKAAAKDAGDAQPAEAAAAPDAKAGAAAEPDGGAQPPAGAEEGKKCDVPAEDEKPKPKEYTPEQIEEIARRVETPADNTPPYEPTRILSPEFGGTSNYERGVSEFREQRRAELARLRASADVDGVALATAEEDIRKLDYLHENYYQGMNVFRTAKGGRSKLRE